MNDTPGYMVVLRPDAERNDVDAFQALWRRLRVEIVAMNPDPLRPVDTDDPGVLATSSSRRVASPPADRTLLGDSPSYGGRPVVPVVPLVIALGVIVGILVAWAVR